jgi:hypothetical protein
MWEDVKFMTKQLYRIDLTDPKIAKDFGVVPDIYHRYGSSARQALSYFVASECERKFYLVHYFGDRIDRYVWPVEEETVLAEDGIPPMEQYPKDPEPLQLTEPEEPYQYPLPEQQEPMKKLKQLPLFKI